MVDAAEVYAATLQEVKRQAAQLRRAASGSKSGGGGGGSGDASAASKPSSAPASSGDALSEASGSGSGWVVLESASTPAALPGEAGGCSVWPQAQWQVAYEILFCQCPPGVAALRPHAADDMLFFAYTDEAAAAARSRLFVRRRQARTPALPADLAAPPTASPGRPAGGQSSTAAGAAPSSKAGLVDWRASVLLMVVLQTGYRLSVVTADDPELLNAALEEEESGAQQGQQAVGSSSGVGKPGGSSGGLASSEHLRRVTKVVHASPSHVPVNLDQSRSDAGRPQASYPDICFAVDSCDDAFQSQVLRQAGDCYCVVLHADAAQSWSLPAAKAAAAAAASSGESGPGDVSGGSATAAAGNSSPDALAAGLAGLALSDAQQQQPTGRRRSSSSSGAAGEGSSRPGSGSRSSVQQAAQTPASAVVFSGYVSHSQLTSALGNQLAGDPVRLVLRAAAAAARGQPGGGQGGSAEQGQPLATCRVSMRGPGGQGSADVAVSSYPPAAAGSSAAAGGGGIAAPPAAAAAAAGGSPAGGRSSGKPNIFERAQLLAKGVAAAAKQAAAGPRAGGGAAAGGVPVEQLQLRCALMALEVPVDMLAAAILEAL